jgi:hypothetical protein
MRNCKYCQKDFEWAFDTNTSRWVPLVPLDQAVGLTRTYVDNNGVLRAMHREVCTETPKLTVTKLDKPMFSDASNM